MSSNKKPNAPGGVSEALRRIAEGERSHATDLDLSGLGLDDAAFEKIGERLARLEWLETLHLGLSKENRRKSRYEIARDKAVIRNALYTLPAALAVLLHLKHLDLSWNQLALLPAKISQLTALTELNLNNNRLTALPSEIGELMALTELDLSNNQLIALPPDIGKLTALTRLNPAGNQLTALPPEIGKLTALTELNLANNQLASLPPDIGKLTSLTGLDLANNQLTSLPPNIGKLTSLTGLDLANNQLTSLPPEIVKLTALTGLTVDNNQLTSLPPEIFKLTALTALSIDNNQLTSLPPEIFELTALTALRVDNNQLTSLPPQVGKLTALMKLDLAENQLTSLPPEIGKLTALYWLAIDNNQLTSLPPEMGKLTALEYAYFYANQLTSLPAEIGKLAALTVLELNDNPLVSPPPEIVKQGIDAIRSFLNATARTGRPVYEAKVVLVGEAGVGKTQLREWLLAGEFREPGASTRALEVRTWAIPNPHDAAQPAHIHIWDFGGQDEYRPSQQLFFTEGALYLMVFNGRKGIADGRVEEWLRLIRLRVGPRARVLLVATNAIETDISPSLNELPRDLLDMCVRRPDGRPLSINSRETDGRSIHGLLGPEGLIARVQKEAADLDAFKQLWPGEWLDTRDAALSPATYDGQEAVRPSGVPSVIYYGLFRKIAKSKGVADDQIHNLATALSLSGRLTYKGDKDAPGQLVVLDSEWLMKAIGYVLSAPEVKATGGVLRRTHLSRIWITHDGLADSERSQAITYAPDMHEHLLLLMTKHDISYRLNEDSWLVAQCVSDAMPDPLPWSFAPRPNGPVLCLTCQLTGKIHGLASLLTVRNHFHHANIKDHAWQRGVFLSHPVQKAEALIRVDGERRVDIETRGPDADVFISELKGSLDKIITDTWRAAGTVDSKPYKYRVPCPTCEQGSYGYDDLRTDYLRGKTDSSCEEGERCDNKVAQLLEGLSRATDLTPEMRTQMRAATNEAPHIITITKVPGSLFGLINTKYRIDIHCEYSERIVPKATETLAFDTKMWTALQEWGPGLFISAAKVAMGMDFDLPGKREVKRRNQEVKAAVEQLGRLERAPQTWIEKEFGDRLAQIARRAGMTQIEMHNDGRLLWVAPDIARGQDPNRAKDPT